MFDDQTPSNIPPCDHLVWCCFIVFDKMWRPSNIRSSNLKHFFCSRAWWAMVRSFWQPYQTCWRAHAYHACSAACIHRSVPPLVYVRRLFSILSATQTWNTTSDLFLFKYLFLIFQSVYKSFLVTWTNIVPVSPHSLCPANSSEQKPFFKSTYIADCPMFYQATPTGYHQFCLS